MKKSIIIVTTAYQAKIFRLDVDQPLSAQTPECKLQEIADLANPEQKLRSSEKFSDTRPGLRRENTIGPRHAVSDHRDQQVEANILRFAHDLLETASQLAHDSQIKRIVFVAESSMLGFLRKAGSSLDKHGFEVHEYPKNLFALSLQDLHDKLAEENLLPQRPSYHKLRAEAV